MLPKRDQWLDFNNHLPKPAFVISHEESSDGGQTAEVQLNDGDRIIINTSVGYIVVSTTHNRVRMMAHGATAALGNAPCGMITSPDHLLPPQDRLTVEIEPHDSNLRQIKFAEFKRHRRV